MHDPNPGPISLMNSEFVFLFRARDKFLAGAKVFPPSFWPVPPNNLMINENGVCLLCVVCTCVCCVWIVTRVLSLVFLTFVQVRGLCGVIRIVRNGEKRNSNCWNGGGEL